MIGQHAVRRCAARLPRLAALAALGAVLASVATGCAGTELVSDARELRKVIRAARDSGAYVCAPRELALAETHTEFAERELDQGDYFRGKDHLRIADESAREAIRLSPKDKCAAPAVSARRPSPAPVDVVVERLDGDGDGLADDADRCPADPEDKDGYEDDDGCPDTDNDRDGVADVKDACPLEPEDRDSFQDDDGCPDQDNDGDSILDANDQCPGEPEDKDGFQDVDGCPDPDNDGDSVLDGADRCPAEPGPPDDAGCPKKFEHIVVTADKIELRQKVFFGTGQATILSRSYPLLNEVATAAKERPAMKLRIEGHTDIRGNRTLNTKLSQSRANAVREYLVGHGIDASRLEAKGFGPDQPIETNRTAAGREKNRRVEFFITEQ